jgi:hypothetical protein
MGFLEPIKKVPFFINFLNRVIRPALAELKPDVVVPRIFTGSTVLWQRRRRPPGAGVLLRESPGVGQPPRPDSGIEKMCGPDVGDFSV